MAPRKHYPIVVDLTTELENMDNSALQKLSPLTPGSYLTIKDFWDDFIIPHNQILFNANRQVVINWKNLLKDYVKKEDAVYAIRAFSTGPSPKNSDPADQALAAGKFPFGKSNNPFTLRRGFYTEFDNTDISYFYTDNFYAAYFFKMCLDGFYQTKTPKEFYDKMKDRTFPARFGRSESAERARAAYSIDGRQGVGSKIKALNPGFTTLKYKISHVVDSGMNYIGYSSCKDLQAILSLFTFLDRGIYADWKNQGSYFSRKTNFNNNALAFLKAHFMRLACPMNYVVTPHTNYSYNNIKFIYQTRGPKAVVNYTDIGELTELQQYIMIQLYKIYGQDYIDYLDQLMLYPNAQAAINALLPKEQTLAAINIDLTVYNPPLNIAKNGSVSTVSSSSSNAAVNSITSSSIASAGGNKTKSTSKRVQPTIQQIIDCLYDFLFKGLALIEIDTNVFNRPNSHGNVSYKIRNKYGLSNERKGAYQGMSLDAAIAQGVPEDAQALKFIKDNTPKEEPKHRHLFDFSDILGFTDDNPKPEQTED